MIVSSIAGDSSSIRVAYQIDQSALIAFHRINLGDDAVGRELQARNGIRHEILSDVVKTGKFTVLADQNLLQSSRSLNAVKKLISHAFGVGRSIQSGQHLLFMPFVPVRQVGNQPDKTHSQHENNQRHKDFNLQRSSHEARSQGKKEYSIT